MIINATHTAGASDSPLCVLGMHRSGTSLVAGILHILGVSLGPEEQLPAPAYDNPKGFWEHQGCKSINEAILEKLGGDWQSVPVMPSGWEKTVAFAGLRQRARVMLGQDFGEAGVWAWKDPRTCLTLPFWQSLLPSLRYLVCLRHPISVAASLQQRNSLSVEKGVQLWLDYMLAALEYSADQPRLFLFYEDFIENWQLALTRLAYFIGPPISEVQPATYDTAKAFIESELQHHQLPPFRVSEDTRPAMLAQAFYQTLKLYAQQQAALQTALQQKEQTAVQQQSSLAAWNSELQRALEQLGQVSHQNLRLQQRAQLVAQELEAFRNRKIIRWIARFRPGLDFSPHLPPALQQLKEESVQATPDLSGFRLQPSENLTRISALTYPLRVSQPKLAGIRLAPFFDIPLRTGTLGIEILSAAQTVVVHSVIPCEQLNESAPVCFAFPPIVDSDRGPLTLKVFVRNVTENVQINVRILEWRKPHFGGLGRLQTHVRCGLLFAWSENGAAQAGEGALASPLQPVYKTSIIVVTHNNMELTRGCIDSIYRCTSGTDWELIVVDNASVDGTRAYLRELLQRHDNMTCLLNDQNESFARANNQGIRRAVGEQLVLLNNDTLVTPRWLDRFGRYIAADPSIGMIGPVTNSVGNEAKIAVDYANLEDMLEFAERRAQEHHRECFEITMLALFCALIPRRIFDEVGLLDERFEVGMFEDDDFARRVRQAGYKIVCAEDVFIHHEHSATFKLFSQEWYQQVHAANLKKFEDKWGTWEPHKYREQ